MKIGILQCDAVRPEFQHEFGDYPEMFEELLTQIDDQLIFHPYRVQDGVFPSRIDECDAYLMTGSRFGVYDDQPWIEHLRAFVTELNERRKKLVGVCFGHQLIADTLGGHAAKSPRGWGVGVATWRVQKTALWMQPPLGRLALLVSHQDQVKSLPRNSTSLAGSDFCPIAMYQIGEHILGIQGHPEFHKGYAEALLHMRRDLIGSARVNAAMESLEEPTHHIEVARWIVGFMSSTSAAGGQ